VVLPLNGEENPKYWSLKIAKKHGNTLDLSVTVSACCSIGKWYVKLNSVNKNDEKPALKEWHYSKPIYIILNAWCKGKKYIDTNQSNKRNNQNSKDKRQDYNMK